jgi:hypothetical protein
MIRRSLYVALLLCSPFVVIGRQAVRFRNTDENVGTQVESVQEDRTSGEIASSFLQTTRDLQSLFSSTLVCPTGSDLEILCEDFAKETTLLMMRPRRFQLFKMKKNTVTKKKKTMKKKKTTKKKMMKKKKNDDSVKVIMSSSKSGKGGKGGKGMMSKSKSKSKSKGKGMMGRRTDEMTDMQIENANRLLKTTIYIIDDDATDDDATDDATDDSSDDNVSDDQVIIDDTVVGDEDDDDATYLDELMEKCCPATTVTSPVAPTAPTAPTPGFLEEGPEVTAPSKEPLNCDLPVADGGSDAYVYCPGKSMCFLDVAFNGGSKASGWGFNIAYDALKDGNLEGCQIWMGVKGCDLSTGTQVGTATITPELFHFCLDDGEYASNSYQLYAGKCVASDAGLHTQNSGICQSSAISVFANKPQNFPMVSSLGSFTSTYTFDQSDSINTENWSGYGMFPIGAGARKFIVAHVYVYPVVKVTPPSPAPSDVFLPDATTLPTKPPSSAPTSKPTMLNTTAPVSIPTIIPISIPVSIAAPVAVPVPVISAPTTMPVPVTAPTAVPVTAPFASPTSLSVTAPPGVPVASGAVTTVTAAPVSTSTLSPTASPTLAPISNLTIVPVSNATFDNTTGACP